ncbi:hypothetical protein CDAR_475931 [Caerostris darwini]|uniref:Uncharacterized protein n=1 Tax=Caerostris darwini TaxID=1538125 RepID=A0AAV4P8P6_9ARAC|nr:hypothetical protein CDAR_475931 [Caerostris darwini]
MDDEAFQKYRQALNFCWNTYASRVHSSQHSTRHLNISPITKDMRDIGTRFGFLLDDILFTRKNIFFPFFPLRRDFKEGLKNSCGLLSRKNLGIVASLVLEKSETIDITFSYPILRDFGLKLLKFKANVGYPGIFYTL